MWRLGKPGRFFNFPFLLLDGTSSGHRRDPRKMKHTILIGIFAFMLVSVASGCGSTQNTPANSVSKPASPTNSTNSNAAVNSKSAATSAAPAKSEPFKKTVELHGIKFTVESPNSASDNSVTITPAGLTVSNEPVVVKINGSVSEAEVGDLNIDQSPEIYVFYRESDGLKRARVVAYSANNKKSLSDVSMREPNTASAEYKGYNGEDDMAIVESVLVHRFPVFDGSGANAKKTGKTKQVQYKIKPGEATWQFVVDRTSEY